MVLFLSECKYDAERGELRVGPSFGFLRCPDPVYANEGEVGDRTQLASGPPQIREFSWSEHYVLKELYESNTVTNMIVNQRMPSGPSPYAILVPGPASQEPRRWRFKVSIASLGFIGPKVDWDWRGLRVEDPKSGIGQMMIGHRFRRPSKATVAAAKESEAGQRHPTSPSTRTQ
jgi:hypothetical protein